jgi:hypothetical protein
MPSTAAEGLATKMQILTTGDLATAFGVSRLTAQKWIDSGLLKGHVVPGRNDRRALLRDVLAFAAAHNLPTSHPLLSTEIAEPAALSA